MARPGGEAYLRSMSDLCGCADFEPSSGFVRAGGVQERCFSLFPLTFHQQEPERAREQHVLHPPPRTPRPSYLHLRHGHLRRSQRMWLLLVLELRLRLELQLLGLPLSAQLSRSFRHTQCSGSQVLAEREMKLSAQS
ncbi:hypothetical protein OF846_003482 [Rhodotorula toruloides]|nr:hypothetical protein OF846_003482 [Rhodotorula toruloides]